MSHRWGPVGWTSTDDRETIVSDMWTERHDDITIWSDVRGPVSGTPVVLIPPEQRTSAVFSSDLLDDLVDAGHRVIRVDLRDQGRSSWVGRDQHYGASELRDDLLAVLDTHDVEAAVIVGVGLGGQVALRLALDHPSRVLGLGLVNTSAWPLDPAIDGPSETTMASLTIRQAVDNPADLQATLSRHCVIWAGDQATTTATVEQVAVAEWLEHGHNPRSAHWRAVLEFEDQTARLGAVTAATLVLHGERDPLCPVAHGRRLAELIPGAELQVVEGAGHSVRSVGADRLVSAVGHLVAVAETVQPDA